MASILDPVNFDPAAFRKELNEFDSLLKSKSDLKERDEIIPFFNERDHLTAFIGTLYLSIAVATELCFDFDITGNFKADLLLGSRAASQFCIVEFEPGQEDAIFKKQKRGPLKTKKAHRIFGPRSVMERLRSPACSSWDARRAWTMQRDAVWHGEPRRSSLIQTR